MWVLYNRKNTIKDYYVTIQTQLWASLYTCFYFMDETYMYNEWPRKQVFVI